MPSTLVSIDLAGLPSTSLGHARDQNWGRRSAWVDNLARRLLVAVTVTLGQHPGGDRRVLVHLLRDLDGQVTDDATGSLWCAVLNAQRIGELRTGAEPLSGDVLAGEWVVDDPGPRLAIHVCHNTGVDLAAAGHAVRVLALPPE